MIVLSAGHHARAQGASHNGVTEYLLAGEWVNIIAMHLRDLEPVQLVPPGPLEQKVAWINSIVPAPVLAAEIHFNSDESKKQRGSETLYCPRSMLGGLSARLVQQALGDVMSPNRGHKEGWYRMDKPGHVDYPGDVDGDEAVDFFLKTTKCPALIIEPEFIYNRDAINTNRDRACTALARALHEAAEEIRRLKRPN